MGSCPSTPVGPGGPPPVPPAPAVPQRGRRVPTANDFNIGDTFHPKINVRQDGGVVLNDTLTTTDWQVTPVNNRFSDHSMIIYQDIIGTWNIGMQAKRTVAGYDNHKFVTNGNPIIETAAEYLSRLDNILQKVRQIFNDNPRLVYLVLQEVSFVNYNGQSTRQIIDQFTANTGLSVDYSDAPPSEFVVIWRSPLANLQRIPINIPAPQGFAYNMVAYKELNQNRLIINTHCGGYDLSNQAEEVSHRNEILKYIDNFQQTYAGIYDTYDIIFIGDFNTPIASAKPDQGLNMTRDLTIFTTPNNDGYSFIDNYGTTTGPNSNIDLCIVAKKLIAAGRRRRTHTYKKHRKVKRKTRKH